ncbi:alpha/beta hydrolase fold domain-containing protein [Schaalia sp. 19OD2882]|uniref:alpha/beta hydrolase fold domain-containing protein n=1 Tax=Schaalia sp. 19OD2882 TaxID=2794089 RepID=UPI001C1EF00B|nr:alpha/beta hydrolase fold domain-containing protein [Schaalia sp. 19OD2882]QWW18978.1 alpha/beta hydrolase fold domain-containing protein [Schaalia sp. 19OD2882]
MGHKYDVPALWCEQMGRVVDTQNELAEGAYVTGQSLQEMRQAYRTERAFWNEGGPEVPLTVDRKVPTRHGHVRVRSYRPGDQGSLALIVYVHGGGWVIGDVDTHDRITRTLCHLTGAVVASIDYTLAPEARFPHQIEECRDVVAHIRRHADEWGIDPADVSFAGDSAGANMAAATMLMMRDEGSLPSARSMLLFYGAYGLKDSMSMRLLGGPWDGLTEDDYRYYLDQYFASPADADHPLFNILANDLSCGVPPCHVVAAGLDPLRDDSRTLAEMLTLAGVPHLLTEVEGVIHGFLHHSKMLDQTMEVLAQAAHFHLEHPLDR